MVAERTTAKDVHREGKPPLPRGRADGSVTAAFGAGGGAAPSDVARTAEEGHARRGKGLARGADTRKVRGQGQERRPGRTLLGAGEVAEYFGAGTATVYRWCREGRIPCLKIGKYWRVGREGLVAFTKEAEESERARRPR